MHHHTILITGGSGYIGRPTAHRLAGLGYRVVVIDTREFHHIPGFDIESIKGDIRNLSQIKKVFQRYHPDLVIHFAALTSVSESEKKKKKYQETNIHGLEHILSSMTDAGCRKILFSSSSAVYRDSFTPVKEDALLSPLSFYGQTKLEGERLIQDSETIQYGILRYFNVVGTTAGGEFGEALDHNAKLIPSVLSVALGIRKKAVIYGTRYATPDGTAIRDYVALEDVVRANVLAVEHSQMDSSSFVCNIGTGRGMSNRDIVHAIEKHVKKRIPCIYRKARKEPVVSLADYAKAASILGWKPVCSDISSIVSSLVFFQKRHHP